MLSQDEQYKLAKFYEDLEHKFKLHKLSDVFQYYPDKLSNELRTTIRVESLLPVNYTSDWFIDKLPSIRADSTIIPYLESRLRVVQNNHLKARYLHLCYVITRHNRYLSDCISFYKDILSEYYQAIEHDYNAVYFNRTLRIMIELCKKDKGEKKKITETVLHYLNSPEVVVRVKSFIIDTLQQTELLSTKDAAVLPSMAFDLAQQETDKNFIEKDLLAGLYFAHKCQDTDMARQINEALGDYEYSNIIPYEVGNKNLAIPLINKSVYKRMIKYYGNAKNFVKRDMALLELKDNDKYVIIPKIGTNVPIKDAERKNREVTQHIEKLIGESSQQICLHLCMGGPNLLFIPLDMIRKSVEEGNKRYSYMQYFQSVVTDINGNDHEVDNIEHGIMQFYRISLSMSLPFIWRFWTATMKNKKLSYSKLSRFLSKSTLFGQSWQIERNGESLQYSWMQMIDIGLKEFFKQCSKILRGQNTDWRFTIEFLSMKFEGILRDIIQLSGENIVKENKQGEVVNCLLDDLLRTETIRQTFDEDDRLLFNYVFTSKGLNIRNNVAHCFYKPQDYCANNALLVLLCILRLGKFIPKVNI